MSFTLIRSALVAAFVTLFARAGHAVAPMATHSTAELTIGATVVRSCAVGTAAGFHSFDASDREALIKTSYAALETTCNVDSAHIELGAAQLYWGTNGSGEAVLDVEL